MAEEAAPGPGAPLDGVRVLALEHMASMPYATQVLRNLGAEVVKIEPVGTGEAGRGSQPTATATDGREVGAVYLRSNLGKRSVALDLRTERGRELARALAVRFDVFAENMRPGVAERLGLGYDELSARAPGLVYASVSGFGNLGASPYRSWPAYGPVAEAMAGIYDLAAADGDAPTPGTTGALGDLAAASFAATGIAAALVRRLRTGEGSRVDISMLDAALALNDMPVQLWSMDAPVDIGPRRGVGIYAAFRARDGYFVVVVIRPHMFERLCAVIGTPGWLDDPRLATRQGWAAHLDTVVRPAIEAWAADRTKLEASRLLAEAGIAAGPSNGPADVVADGHVQARHMVRPAGGVESDRPVLVVGNPIKFAGVDDEALAVPELGADTDALLAEELGLSPGELTALRAEGVVG